MYGGGGPQDFHMSLEEASERTGRNREWLRRLVSEGRMPALRHGGQWWIHNWAIEAHLEGIEKRAARKAKPTKPKTGGKR